MYFFFVFRALFTFALRLSRLLRLLLSKFKTFGNRIIQRANLSLSGLFLFRREAPVARSCSISIVAAVILIFRLFFISSNFKYLIAASAPVPLPFFASSVEMLVFLGSYQSTCDALFQSFLFIPTSSRASRN